MTLKKKKKRTERRENKAEKYKKNLGSLTSNVKRHFYCLRDRTARFDILPTEFQPKCIRFFAETTSSSRLPIKIPNRLQTAILALYRPKQLNSVINPSRKRQCYLIDRETRIKSVVQFQTTISHLINSKNVKIAPRSPFSNETVEIAI